MNRKEMLERLTKGEDALELSIEKWRDVVDGKGWAIDATNCALCHKYINVGCMGCPVFKRTHSNYCGRTPYYEYGDAKNAGASEDKLKQIAQRELEFLEGLRK